MHSVLESAFSKLGMLEGDKPAADLVATSGASAHAIMEHPRARRIIRDAAGMGASYVLFRRSTNARRPPSPEAFIFDFSDAILPSKEEAEIQRQAWNYGAVPLIFVIRADRVDIISALQRPTLDSEGNPEAPTVADKLVLAARLSRGIEKRNQEVASRYSAYAFANGTFWDNPKNRCLFSKASAQKTLLEQMRRARAEIERRGGMSGTLSRRFFILCLMVKYLEDRKILRGDYFREFDETADDFSALLRNTTKHYIALRRCLRSLARRFNGDVFHLQQAEEDELVATDLSIFADFVEGRLEGTQKHLWRLYSFEHLPVELISYIYEDFLRTNRDAVYTPHMLVDLLLDEVMPVNSVSEEYRVLDPACGSGVFLVGAFRRLVEAYQFRHQLSPGQVSHDKLCELMEENIRGVDIDPVAVELTAFGLCVALSAEMLADAALNELRFPTLAGRSVECRDFFTLTETLGDEPGSFDLIIGNPPFGSDMHEGLAARVSTNRKGPRLEYPPLPDKQLCYLFLREAPKLLKEGGIGCLLQKDGFLYNGGVREFRAAFIANYEVPQIFDFVSIRHLFTGKKAKTEGGDDETTENAVDTKAVAVFFKRRALDQALSNKPILHATFRKLFRVSFRLGFELDAYDYHWVRRELAIEEPAVWKANLLGGGRLLNTYRAFASDDQGTISDFIEGNGADWACSEGYAVGEKAAREEPRLTGLPCLSGQATAKGRVDWSKRTIVHQKKFKSTGDMRIYEPPHLIIWKHESLDSCLRERGGQLAFTKRFVGISCPSADIEKLFHLEHFLNDNKESLLFFPAFGNEMLVNRTSSLLKEDIMRIPFPINGKLVFRGVEAALRDDVLNYQLRFVKDGAQVDSPLFKTATSTQLDQFCRMFEGVLRNTHPQLKAGERFELNNAFCLPFSFGDMPVTKFGDPKKVEEHLDDLLHKQKSPRLRVQRVVRVFDRNSLFFVKPKAFRFWTRSIAVRDADEVFASLCGQGF